MNTNLTDRIAKIIAPHLRSKHKNTISIELANQIIEEIKSDDRDELSWDLK
jgi:hypothetical protein